MGAIHTVVDIERPIDRVFAYVTDLRHDPEWFAGIREVRVLSDVDRGEGAAYEQVAQVLWWRYIARRTVTEYEPPRRMTVEATPFAARYEFEAVGGRPWHATRFTLNAEIKAFRILGPLVMPLLRMAVERRCRVLKRVLETSPD